MKLLQNPIVTGILALIAVIVVVAQVMPHSRLGFGSLGRASIPPVPVYVPPPANVAPSLPVNAQTTPTNAEQEVTPKAPVDKEFVELHFDGWVNWPQRDPFLVMTPDPPELKDKDIDANSPVASWKLNGIWAQTGSKPIAVLNGRIYREGDEVQGYKIIKIDGEEVWFQGPHRKERLGLNRRMPAHP